MEQHIILTHLGDSIPPYMEDCIKQIKLTNPAANIWFILDRPTGQAMSFYIKLKCNLIFTDSLAPTTHHSGWKVKFKGDKTFRQGYWRYVIERFFYIEELIDKYCLHNAISMEYDVLLYGNLQHIAEVCSRTGKLRVVRDNDERAHPGFMYIPDKEAIQQFNLFLTANATMDLSDMQLLCLYVSTQRHCCAYLPVITEARRRSIPVRTSIVGRQSRDCSYLSDSADAFGCLFDSAVIGQYVAGIDPRNTGGKKVSQYENESALYSAKEMPIEWRQEGGLWRPYVDGQLQATIHMHSKALKWFRSDRPGPPIDDWTPADVLPTLVANAATPALQSFLTRIEGPDARDAIRVGNIVSGNDGDIALAAITYKLLGEAGGSVLVMDIGYDCGWWSHFCLAIHPDCRVIAFEPNPISWAVADKVPQITLHNCALSDERGTLQLTLDDGQSHCRNGNHSGIANTVSVDCQTADVYIGDKTFALLKMDIEGHEPAVFTTLWSKLPQLQAIVFECSPFWWGEDVSIAILNRLRDHYKYMYVLSRRGPPTAMLMGDTIAFCRNSSKNNYQTDVLCCHTPL